MTKCAQDLGQPKIAILHSSGVQVVAMKESATLL
jgi:hypothetical protein